MPKFLVFGTCLDVLRYVSGGVHRVLGGYSVYSKECLEGSGRVWAVFLVCVRRVQGVSRSSL